MNPRFPTPLDDHRPASQQGRIRRLRARLRRESGRNRPRFKGLSFNRMIPNLLTMLGLCAGLTSMRFAIEGRFGAAVVAIAVAACIDGLDGRIARLLKATSRFGAEFDSLADFLCFGVAPAFVIYLWSLHVARGYGFMPCLMFAVCMALRLARFNAALEMESRAAYTYNFFTGVPAPAGAGLALFPLSLGLEAQSMGWHVMVKVAQFRCSRRPSWWVWRCFWCPHCRCGASRTSRSRPNTCCPCCSAPGCSLPSWLPTHSAPSRPRPALCRNAALQPAQLHRLREAAEGPDAQEI